MSASWVADSELGRLCCALAFAGFGRVGTGACIGGFQRRPWFWLCAVHGTVNLWFVAGAAYAGPALLPDWGRLGKAVRRAAMSVRLALAGDAGPASGLVGLAYAVLSPYCAAVRFGCPLYAAAGRAGAAGCD